MAENGYVLLRLIGCFSGSIYVAYIMMCFGKKNPVFSGYVFALNHQVNTVKFQATCESLCVCVCLHDFYHITGAVVFARIFRYAPKPIFSA